MNLETKHLASYLPYQLNGIASFLEDTIFVVDTLNSRTLRVVGETKNGNNVPIGCFLKEFKPILRPIEDLAKEIVIDEVKFIPIMFLFGGENYREYDFTIEILEKMILGKRIEISVKDLGSPCITFGLKNPINNVLNYQNWDMLFHWHFDIFGLIENGLAIDINTLSVNGS